MAQTHQVAQAGAQAAASAPPEEAQAAASKAMKRERDRVKLEMADEEIDRIAAALSPKLLQGFADRGAFDAPPEPVKAPDNAVGPAPTEPQPPAGEAAPEPAPAKRTFAHRFMGLR
jgi:hypothetical protein